MRFRLMAAAAASVALAAPALAGAEEIRVFGTTDTRDAGLIDPPYGILLSEFKKAHPDDTITYTAVGTGAALTRARAGDADLVLTHAPSLENQFVKDGYSVGKGKQIFYSDYVIIGPATGSVVTANHAHDAARAYEDIAAAGAANGSSVIFRSRANNSGTNVQEQVIWGLTDTVEKALAFNRGTGTNEDKTRFEPGTSANNVNSYPSWYVREDVGQAANVQACSTAITQSKPCYTMVDRGTWNRLSQDQTPNGGGPATVTNMKIVSDVNDAAAEGGENLLINPFGAYVVSAAKIQATVPNAKVPNEAAAKRVLDFIVSPTFQARLNSFPSSSAVAFFPDAYPQPKITLPQTAVSGTPISLTGTIENRLPGGAAINGMPVQLQRSINGGAKENVGAAVNTDATGKVTFTFTPTATATYSVSTPDFDASEYNQYTAASQDLGTIQVVPAPVTTPPTTPPTNPPVTPPATNPNPTPAVTRPRVSRVRFKGNRISVRLSKRAQIRIRVQRKRGKRFRTVREVETPDLARKGTVRLRVRGLPKGRYRLRINLVDAAGNERNQTVRVRKR